MELIVHRRAYPPPSFLLWQNYPNPFNPSTTIRYGLLNRLQVTLTVFNEHGQQVAQLVDGEVEAGYHEMRFDASGLSSEVYCYRHMQETSSTPASSCFSNDHRRRVGNEKARGFTRFCY